MLERLRFIAKNIQRELKVYRLVLKDKRTPFVAKVLLGIAIGYVISPIDIIPDFIPVLGQLDDLIIVPILILIALKMIPKSVVEECKTRVSS